MPIGETGAAVAIHVVRSPMPESWNGRPSPRMRSTRR